MKSNKSTLIFLFLTCFALGNLRAQVFEKQKNISRSFANNKDLNVEVSNKYGDIHIVPWDKDSISFSVTVKVSDKKEAEALNMLNSIDVEFNSTPYYLTAKTIFRDSKNQVIADLTDIANSLLKIGKNIEIFYVVNIPSSANIKINNKYGNIYTTNHSGSFDVTLSNGDLKVNSLSGAVNNLNISFGNAVINTVTSAKINSSYAEINIKKAEKLFIESKSANVRIEQVEKLEVNSKRDKYYIDSIVSFNGKADFSYFTIYSISGGIYAKTYFGEINLIEMKPSLKFINLNSEYSDISMYLCATCNGVLNMTARKTEFTSSPNIKGLQKVITNEKTLEYTINGNIGADSSNAINILFNSIGGSISLQTK